MQLDIDNIQAPIKADERKLKQVMYNLLSNAVKFTPDGGKIPVQAHPCNIEDISEIAADSPGKGSTFQFVIPV